MATNAIEIRGDLLDIEDEVLELLEMSEMFGEIRDVFKGLVDRDRVAEIEDPQFAGMAEELINTGVDTAITLSDTLLGINDPEFFLYVSDFVKKIREYQDAWLEPDSVLLNRCRAYAGRHKTDCLASAVEAHEFMLDCLKKLDSSLEAIENSDRYKWETEQGLRS